MAEDPRFFLVLRALSHDVYLPVHGIKPLSHMFLDEATVSLKVLLLSVHIPFSGKFMFLQCLHANN